MCEKWYKYKDKCPGCGTEFQRRENHVYLACGVCGLMLGVPSFRESEKPTTFLKHSVGEEPLVPMTIAHFAAIQRQVIEEVERL